MLQPRVYLADEGTTLFTGTAAEGDKDTEEGGVTVSGITENYIMRKERPRIRCWWYDVLERKGGYCLCEGRYMGGHSASEGRVRLLRTSDDNLGRSTYDRGLVCDGEGLPGGWTLHRSSKFGAFAWAVLFSGAGPCAAKATAAHSPEETGSRWSGGRTSCVMCASIGSECFSRSAPVFVFSDFLLFSTQRGQRLLLEAL